MDVAAAGPETHHVGSWLHVLWVGLVLFILGVVIFGLTSNPNLFPTVALLGNFLVPVTYVSFFYQRRHLSRVDLPTTARAFLYGGVLGTFAAALLEPLFINQLTPVSAFVVGLITGWGSPSSRSEPAQAVHAFATNFFVPVYFAVVGLKLDLVHSFAPLLTLLFIAFACLVKAGSVYAGARWAGCPPVKSVNLAVAMNARGGPGIVLATLAYDAGIVNATLFTTLVLTAVITSLMAGSWLDRAIRRGSLDPENTPRRVAAQGHPAPAEAGAG